MVLLLTDNDIPVETQTQTVETFVINPNYIGDSKLLEKVSKPVKKVPGVSRVSTRIMAAARRFRHRAARSGVPRGIAYEAA